MLAAIDVPSQLAGGGPSAAIALEAAERKAQAEYDPGTARLFIAKVQSELFEC